MKGRFGKVAVLMGGPSAERAISLKSGAAVLAALQRKGVDARGIDVDAGILERLRADRFDRAFIALHGLWGEDGTIQGALEILGVPYTGSGVLGSALGMDKLRCKRLWTQAGLATPEFALVSDERALAPLAGELGLPLIVKPNAQGSSLGVSKVKSVDNLAAAWREASAYGREVFVERCMSGWELTAAILGDEVLPLIRLETPREFYDYAAKYEADSTRYLLPSGLPDDSEVEFRQAARRAFDLVGCSGWGRVDFMLDENGVPNFLEVNTIPGMTDHSLVPMAAKHAGIEFDELVVRILETSLERA
jgi:D-alanine-D-alanine ligase